MIVKTNIIKSKLKNVDNKKLKPLGSDSTTLPLRHSATVTDTTPHLGCLGKKISLWTRLLYVWINEFELYKVVVANWLR